LRVVLLTVAGKLTAGILPSVNLEHWRTARMTVGGAPGLINFQRGVTGTDLWCSATALSDNMKLLREINRVLERVPADFGGGSPLEKCYLMAYLVRHFQFKNCVEIGVYRGRSIFPVAFAVQDHQGKVYGIDPYSKECAREDDVRPAIKQEVDRLIENTDFDQIHADVTGLIREFDLQGTVELLRLPSTEAVGFFFQNSIPVEFLHIDGNHDTRFVMQDVQLYHPLIPPGGILVMDDIDWDSVGPAYAWVRERMTLLFEAGTFAILVNRSDGDDLWDLKQHLAILHDGLSARSARLAVPTRSCRPRPRSSEEPGFMVSVCFVTYNQERFVAQALESALEQKVNFLYEIVVADDCSTDSTANICREYQSRYPEKIRILARNKNLGAVPNYLETFKACTGKYVAFLEGDDFWIDEAKLQTQVDFLESQPDFAICCHNVQVVDADGALVQKSLLRGIRETTTVDDLCRGGDYISTPSCVVRNSLLASVPEWMYTLEGCDWALDILNAEHGGIHFMDKPMAAYRVHDGGIWGRKGQREKLQSAVRLVQAINKGTGFRHAKAFQVYDQLVRNELRKPEFEEHPPESDSGLLHQYTVALHELEKHKVLLQRRKKEIQLLKTELRELRAHHMRALKSLAAVEAWQKRSWLTRATRRWSPLAGSTSLRQAISPESSRKLETFQEEHVTKLDLLILDDVFPHPLSAFRFQEFCSYIEAVPNTMVCSSGASFPALGEKRSLEDVIAETESALPGLRRRVCSYDPEQPMSAKVAYIVFLGNVLTFLYKIESEGIPFVFTLYPGGSFKLRDPDTDAVLKKAFRSPCFRKVIVTQSITREYLLEKSLCPAEQIEYIYGVVTPLQHLYRVVSGKRRYGLGKDTLDICFVAHKYSPTGADKGYDMFVEVAKRLALACDYVSFHVVGGFDAGVLDVTELAGRIHFYGHHSSEWFEGFYHDKDIILSPNVPFLLGAGFFDGFPTGCCTDAALHGVAMFCTDILGLNTHFTDRQDIVIIPYELEKIVQIFLHYISHPEELAAVGEAGCQRSRVVYSYENQIQPRLRILQDIIDEQR
jgi:glycosyltransferase involved in cell wall biosynthesis/predicted O-methyltransferase YrrM